MQSQLFSFSIFSLFQLHLNILKLQIENPYYMECHGTGNLCSYEALYHLLLQKLEAQNTEYDDDYLDDDWTDMKVSIYCICYLLLYY